MIRSHRDWRTQDFALGKRVGEFQSFARQAEKRLEILDAAPDIRALMTLPSNRFEALRGNRRGQYSIRINDQWRVCFEWPEAASGPENVDIVDDH
ncbi:MAG: plasmid maintenance system killer protein [Alphaproteobacteria bacterium]|nr:plasmid maintenance system killer protein [Alphaproteobacteria bacterium]